MTVTIQIRDVPEEVRNLLAEEARIRGRPLDVHLLQLIKATARGSRNAVTLARFDDRDDGYLDGPGETAEQVREAGAERTRRLTHEL